MIYAVEILDSKFVKIGFSSYENSSSRIASLQTGCPFEIRELFCVDGTLRQEKTIHAMLRIAFGRIRIPIPPNEWYPAKNNFFQDYLKHMKFGFNSGFEFLSRYEPSVKQCGKKGDEVSPNIKWPK